jgi:hypothetical protein
MAQYFLRHTHIDIDVILSAAEWLKGWRERRPRDSFGFERTDRDAQSDVCFR